MKLLSIIISILIIFTTLLTIQAAEEGLVSIFDGKTLNGWVQKNGKAKYEVVDGTIVGTTVKGEPNSFLCTKKLYSDFILEIDFWVDTGLNSGIQIRSAAAEKEYEIERKNKKGEIKKKKVPQGRVHGYQVEIDPSDRAYTGGIYDEARRGWLYNPNGDEKAQEAFKKDTWNKFRIICKGDSLKTWLNDVPVTDIKDDMTAKGFIALQVHGNKSETPLQVRWRNIKIKEL